MIRSFARRVLQLAPIVLLFGTACSSKSNDAGTTSTPALIPGNTSNWCTPATTSSCAAGKVDVCGICVAAPPSGDVARTTDTKEYAGTGAPDVGCLKGVGIKPLAPAGKTVTLRGYVKIFANGPDSKNVKVEIYKEILDGSGAPTGKLGDKVGETTSVDTVSGLTTKKETVYKAGTPNDRTLYPYEVKGIPTETPFIVKTSSKTSVDVDGWFPLYDYNQVVRDGVAAADGSVAFDVRALGNDDYASILKAAYNRPPEAGKSAIAGEVHDCGDVRLSNATVGIGPTAGLGLFYLSDVEDDPLPESGRKSTSRLGLYAVGALEPSTYTVAAAGKVGGELLGLGSYPVQTFPDSVTVFTFRGLRPWQVKK